MCSDVPIATSRGIVRNMIVDHVTFYQAKGDFQFHKVLNGYMKNCLIIDGLWQGDVEPKDSAAALADSLETSLLVIDSLLTPTLMTDADRSFQFKNNIYGWSPKVLDFFNSVDTLRKPVLFNTRTQRFFDVYEKLVAVNNLEQFVEFSDAPASDKIVELARHLYATKFSNEGNPDPRVDRNGRAALSDDPASFGPAADEFDFDYSPESPAYTHAEGGLPVGDLNWFPDKKAEWEKMVSAVKGTTTGPVEFVLQQNYPNPFNPSTKITYRLDKASRVELIIYNALGQQVRTLVAGKLQPVGNYNVDWDGHNDDGSRVASGLYVYQLRAGDQVQTKKMMVLQ